jgi:cell division protease FtsH
MKKRILSNFWILLLLCIPLLFMQQHLQSEGQPRKISYAEFWAKATAGDVATAVIDNRKETITGKLKDGSQYVTYIIATDLNLASRLATVPIQKYEAKEPDNPFFENFLFYWAPMIVLILVLWFFLFRQFNAAGNNAFTFGKSRARQMTEEHPKTTFADVAGVEESKQELSEIIDFLKDPQKFIKLGARIPKGVLLVGPPGTGKTLLAKAIAGEANVPFFSISGSDFVEMFVGVGASRVRDLFEQGKKQAPCIIFIDEIDAVGRHRGWGMGGGHDEREQTLNALLVEMDGFESKEGVILIAATNRPDILDPALMRPGRFDRTVIVDLPDIEGRLGILKVHARKVPLASSVDLAVIARGTPFFSGADLANLVNEAALLAARRDRTEITRADLEEARDKVMMGPERRSRTISEKEKRIVAFHEAGHAVVAKMQPGTDPIHKVTLVPRGAGMLGAVYHLPERDKYLSDRSEYKSRLATLMGGRVAEELIFGEITGGAGNDIKQATELSRRMVCEFGMSERMGPLAYGENKEYLFLGRDIQQNANYSESTAREIDDEIKRLVLWAHQKAKEILLEHRDLLSRIAETLLEREILDGVEIDILCNGGTLPPRELPVTPPEKPAKPASADSAVTSSPLPLAPVPHPA